MNLIESFILISTDKAVNPSSVMGMTKRVCELMVADSGRRTGRRYASVRFGNVLGSSGSLVPLLKEQIDKGRAITITHHDMRRYFMLIPEAVSLVLKASLMARAGDIMVLSMGDPIRIVDLAKSLIALTGKTEEEVPIIYTGIRPGEKLEEQLYLTGAEIQTPDPEIMVIPHGEERAGATWAEGELASRVTDLLDHVRGNRGAAKVLLARLVNGEPSGASADSDFIVPHSPVRDVGEPVVTH